MNIVTLLLDMGEESTAAQLSTGTYDARQWSQGEAQLLLVCDAHHHFKPSKLECVDAPRKVFYDILIVVQVSFCHKNHITAKSA
jgi:hypothetical protein